MRYQKLLLSVLAVSLVAGCANFSLTNNRYVQNRNMEYLKARSISPLVIPPGLASKNIHSDFPVSDRNYPASELQPNLTPPDMVR